MLFGVFIPGRTSYDKAVVDRMVAIAEDLVDEVEVTTAQLAALASSDGDPKYGLRVTDAAFRWLMEQKGYVCDSSGSRRPSHSKPHEVGFVVREVKPKTSVLEGLANAQINQLKFTAQTASPEVRESIEIRRDRTDYLSISNYQSGAGAAIPSEVEVKVVDLSDVIALRAILSQAAEAGWFSEEAQDGAGDSAWSLEVAFWGGLQLSAHGTSAIPDGFCELYSVLMSMGLPGILDAGPRRLERAS